MSWTNAAPGVISTSPEQTAGSPTPLVPSLSDVAAAGGGLQPAAFLGNVTSLAQNLLSPAAHPNKWYFVDGIAGSMSGTNAPSNTVEDGGYIFSDGAAWNVRSAAPYPKIQELKFRGVWDVGANSPDLSALSPSPDDYYIVSAGGSSSITGASVTYSVNDRVAYTGSAWVYLPGPGGVIPRLTTTNLASLDLTDRTGEVYQDSDVGSLVRVAGGSGLEKFRYDDLTFTNTSGGDSAYTKMQTWYAAIGSKVMTGQTTNSGFFENSGAEMTGLKRLNIRLFGAKVDGTTDDLAAIQAAEDYCSGLGHPVELEFPPGVTVVSNYLQKKSNVHWVGSCHIKNGSGTAFPVIRAKDVSNWSINGLKIEAVANTVSHTAASITLSNCGVLVIGCDRWSVRNCVFTKFFYGIRILKAHKFQVTGNYFDAETGELVEDMWTNGEFTNTAYGSSASPAGNASILGSDISSYPAYSDPEYSYDANDVAWSDYIIANNLCMSVGFDSGVEASVQVYDPTPGLITGNIIQGKHHGVSIYRGSNTDPGSAETASRVTQISNNYIHHCWENGIYLRGGLGYLVVGNLLYRNNRCGEFNSQTGGGICLRVTPETVYTVSTSPTFDSPSVVIGNYIIDTGDPDQSGVSASGGAIIARNNRCVIKDNVIVQTEESGLLGRGIGIGNSSGTCPSFFDISSNTISGFYRGIYYTTVSASSAALYKTGGPYVVKNNIITGCPDYGILTQLGGSGIIYQGNHIETTGKGIGTRQTPHAKILDNTISSGVSAIELQDGNSANYMFDGEQPSVRRGASIVIRGNMFLTKGTSGYVSRTNTNGDGDGLIESRVLYCEGNVGIYGEPVDNQILTSASPESISTTLGRAITLQNGMKIWDQQGFQASHSYAICTVSGTNGSPTGSPTGTTDGTTAIVAVSDYEEFFPGCWITIAGTGNGPFRVISVDNSASTITLESVPDTLVVAAAIDYYAPTLALSGVV